MIAAYTRRYTLTGLSNTYTALLISTRCSVAQMQKSHSLSTFLHPVAFIPCHQMILVVRVLVKIEIQRKSCKPIQYSITCYRRRTYFSAGLPFAAIGTLFCSPGTKRNILSSRRISRYTRSTRTSDHVCLYLFVICARMEGKI